MNSSERTFRIADWTVMATGVAGGRPPFRPGAIPRAASGSFLAWEPEPPAAVAEVLAGDTPGSGPGAQPTAAGTQAEGSTMAETDAPADPSGTIDVIDALPTPVAQPDLAELEALRALAFEAGVAAGRSQGHSAGRAEALAELAQERELLRCIGASLDAFSSDPNARFEPLKRLALHLAQELVRCELSLSPHAVDHLVRACVAALDAPGSKAVVSLSRSDYQMMASDPARTSGLTLECVEQLSPGSVQVRADDARVRDFIEHRLASLASTLLLHARPGTEP